MDITQQTLKRTAQHAVAALAATVATARIRLSFLHPTRRPMPPQRIAGAAVAGHQAVVQGRGGRAPVRRWRIHIPRC